MDKTHPVDIDRLLIVTFSNAAAEEMRQRIAKRLYEKIEEILDWLENIEDNKLVIREDRYYIVKSVSYGDITTQALRFYEITITFTLKPFAYDPSEKEITITSGKTLNNLGNVYYKLEFSR